MLVLKGKKEFRWSGDLLEIVTLMGKLTGKYHISKQTIVKLWRLARR